MPETEVVAFHDFLNNLQESAADKNHVQRCVFHVLYELKKLNLKNLTCLEVANLVLQSVAFAPPVNGAAYLIPFKGKVTYVLGYRTAAAIYARQNPDSRLLLTQVITKKRYERLKINSVPLFQDSPEYIPDDPIDRYTVAFVALKQLYKDSESVYITYTFEELFCRIQHKNTDAWSSHFSSMIVKVAKTKFYQQHIHSDIR
jgi:recombinational DNA repair protein RecT